MASVTVHAVGAAGLAEDAGALARFEAGFVYPLAGGGQFRIDHGADYAAFFRRLGAPCFLVARRGEEIVGMLTVLRKTIRCRGATAPAYYLADLKVAASARGGGISARLYRRAAMTIIATGGLAPRVYFIGMRAGTKDVRASARPASLLRLFRPVATVAIYFAPPALLVSMPQREWPPETAAPVALALSPEAARPIVDLRGIKDLREEHGGDAAPVRLALVHACLGDATGGALAARLAAAAEACTASRASLVAFAIDRRRTALVAALAEAGLEPRGEAVVCAAVTGRAWPGPLAVDTHEI